MSRESGILNDLKTKILSSTGAIRRLFKEDGHRRIIVNCGGHRAEYVRKLRSELDPYDDYFVHTFEPNPVYAKGYEKLGRHKLHTKAVWTYDGKIRFYFQENEMSHGHSVCREKGNIDPDKYIEAECIDFGAWIKNNFSKDDHIIVRMDIEGAEYEVLRHIVQDGSIEYIDRLLVEFHHRKYPELATEEEYAKLLDSIPIPVEEIPC